MLARFVGELLDQKGREVDTIEPDLPVFAGLKILAEKDIGALVVVSDGVLLGIFSERDYARKIILNGKRSEKTLIREIMTKKVITASRGDTIKHCMQLMTEHRIRHIPVVDDGALSGIVSIGDIVSAIIDGQKQDIEYLEDYIVGKR